MRTFIDIHGHTRVHASPPHPKRGAHAYAMPEQLIELKYAEVTGLPLTFHLAAQISGMYGLYDESGLPGLEYSLKRFPELNCLGHSQTFWAEIARLETPGDRYGYKMITETVFHKVARENAIRLLGL